MRNARTVWIVGLLLFLYSAILGFGQEALTVYVEGEANAKNLQGKILPLEIGNPLKSGESVITRTTGRADLELPNKSLIQVKPNTVFTLSEVELEGEKQTVLATTVGSVSYRLNKFTGRGPSIRTAGAVAGVRGTDLTVYAGADGSTLVLVEQGAVAVEAVGKEVTLEKNEAVEVKPGSPPGEKFTWIGKQIDYSAWNRGKMEEFLKDPVAGIERVALQLEIYRKGLAEILPVLARVETEVNKVYEELKKAVEAKDEARATQLREELLKGVGANRRILFLNKRFYALSYLSLRRYVGGGLYLQMKSRYITKPTAPVYVEFLERYKDILKKFEETIVPHLVEADI
ncbi:MAG: FecR domain-containing protein [Spirochaetes bacterium]|nr:FecR domain-containing protein [Spirochaetota bacterium]